MRDWLTETEIDQVTETNFWQYHQIAMRRESSAALPRLIVYNAIAFAVVLLGVWLLP